MPGVTGTPASASGRPCGLKTDHYEVTMVQAALADGVAGRRAVFELFARALPEGRRYGVFAGLGRLVDLLAEFRFTDEDVAFLERSRVAHGPALEYLAGFRFGGTVRAYREGELFFPRSPVLTVEGTLAEGLLVETLVSSVCNHDSAIASAAARMVRAAGGRPLVEMGSRRTDDEAALSTARAAYLAGFAATSNLEAGRRYGVPTTGTAAHAFTLAYEDEQAAFDAQLRALGTGTTLLVDTYDTADGVDHAVAAARALGAAGPGAIRIDSGDLAAEAVEARARLDAAGATGTRIVVSSDLDEFAICDLLAQDIPVDAFGVGTRLASGSGHPTAGFVYKLVAVARRDGPDAPLAPVAKRSEAKTSVGGRKWAFRCRGDDGHADAELVVVDGSGPPPCPAGARPLQVVVVDRGTVVHRPTLDEVRRHHVEALAELRPRDRVPDPGPPAVAVTVVGAPPGVAGVAGSAGTAPDAR